jgi:hypothetical protein
MLFAGWIITSLKLIEIGTVTIDQTCHALSITVSESKVLN